MVYCTRSLSALHPFRTTLQHYRDRSGHSGVTQYQHGADFIVVRFRGGVEYRYGRLNPGQHHVDRMKALAIAGRGLGTYISQHVRALYESKKVIPQSLRSA